MVFGPRGLRPLSMLTHAGLFCLLWMFTNYLYIRALGVIHPADVTALFSSSNAFVYVLSWIWLKERISIIRVFMTIKIIKAALTWNRIIRTRMFKFVGLL